MELNKWKKRYEIFLGNFKKSNIFKDSYEKVRDFKNIGKTKI